MKTAARSTLVVMLVASLVPMVQAQSDKDRIFSDADAARAQAIDAQARELAPKTFAKAEKEYARAVGYFEKNRGSARLIEQLNKTEAIYQDAEATAETSKVELSQALESREAAKTVDAEERAAELWASGEKGLAAAVKLLEADRLENGRKEAREAHLYYREAELNAIKADLLAEPRGLIAKARDLKVERYAPSTLQLSEALLGKADSALTEDRYDHPPVIELAAQASYEARHATNIANEIKLLKDGTKTEELFIRSWEEPLERLAAAADVPATLDKGPDEMTDAIKAKIVAMSSLETELKGQLEAQSTRIADLEQELAAMDELLEEMAVPNQSKSMVSEIENLFSPAEAEIMVLERKGLLIRLVGLEFASGSAELPRSNSVVLKLPDVLRAYPDRRMTIEGHTDSSGASDTNLRLSQSRADSLKDYLTNELGYRADLVRSIGFGETRPIATNDTAAGRAKNRRIDILIANEIT